ncbi:hypothetical protein CLI64_03380 [Nostoc sp. CENA543]|uniref:hypothetical protein n=1 Tax=Nostoc sp. CENA543 TaxID=1869241 RepID=UPI000CA26200|nr:hypothetical protein [Nostoc sp. CENA543]AUS99504.1 hypothetical protein CLI64_03380 [Nostoc sp. CENA543]
MTANTLLSNLLDQKIIRLSSQEINLPILQDKIYSFFMEVVNLYPPENVLHEFKRLFVGCLLVDNLNHVPIIKKLLLLTDEQEFHNTIKRCCYILINNWATKRKYQYVRELIDLFSQLPESSDNISKNTLLYRQRLNNFVGSQDYQELKIFNYKNEYNNQGHWSDRYAAYLLVAQSLDTSKPKEQQEAAIKIYRQMKDKYKFDLAMYIARSQSEASSSTRYTNPSILGDNVLYLIKKIVAKKGKFSHDNLANIFLKQTDNQTLLNFKISLQKYLFLSVGSQELVVVLRKSLREKLDVWKTEIDAEIINKNLLLRICNKLIDYLTIENRHEPSELFNLLVSQGHPLTLVIILLKIILISPYSRSHLETRIAALINYYQHQSEEECKWIIYFIEVFNITFAIYAENVDYNLLKMTAEELDNQGGNNINSYRVFSQIKQ